MDLITVRETRTALSREDLRFGAGERPLGGGTWLFSEQQDGTTGLVDLTRMPWPDIEESDAALTISATATVKTLADLQSRDWPAAILFGQAANSLLASFKIWNVATVGGNICTALPAGPMTSLAAALDAEAVIWSATAERRLPVRDFVQGVRKNDLAHDEVLRAIEIPRASLESRTGFRRIALSPLGRSGTLVIGRVDPGGERVFTVTAGTSHPWVFRFSGKPSAIDLAASLDQIDDWYDDPHGSPDWREAMSRRFAEELRTELS